MIFKDRLRFSLFIVVIFSVLGCASNAPLRNMQITDARQKDTSTDYLPVLEIGDTLALSYFLSTALDPAPYQILVGDILQIEVLDHPQLSRPHVLVLPDGYVSLPLVGRIKVAGKVITTLTNELGVKYKVHQIAHPEVTVSVESSNDPLIALLSSSNSQRGPIVVTIDGSGFIDLPLIGRLPSAGLFTQVQAQIVALYAEKFGARLSISVSLNKQRPLTIHVIGEVVKPGNIIYSKRLNPLIALASAGGKLATSDISDIRLYRFKPDGSYHQWRIDLTVATPPITLLPYDVVFVPKTGIAVANDAIAQYVRNLVPFQTSVGASYELNQ